MPVYEPYRSIKLSVRFDLQHCTNNSYWSTLATLKCAQFCLLPGFLMMITNWRSAFSTRYFDITCFFLLKLRILSNVNYENKQGFSIVISNRHIYLQKLSCQAKESLCLHYSYVLQSQDSGITHAVSLAWLAGSSYHQSLCFSCYKRHQVKSDFLSH